MEEWGDSDILVPGSLGPAELSHLLTALVLSETKVLSIGGYKTVPLCVLLIRGGGTTTANFRSI